MPSKHRAERSSIAARDGAHDSNTLLTTQALQIYTHIRKIQNLRLNFAHTQPILQTDLYRGTIVKVMGQAQGQSQSLRPLKSKD